MLKAGIEKRELGMTPLPGGGSGMLLWSPDASSAGISVEGKGYFALEKRDYGYWEGILPGIHSGDRYMVVIDDEYQHTGSCFIVPAGWRSQPFGSNRYLFLR
jgi:1,4-alpha-glucan branching enzyme